MASCGETSGGDILCLFRELTEEPKIVEHSEDKVDAVKIQDEPDVTLADGMPLPKYLRNDFPDLLFGKLIYEIDPFYENKNTFVVIGRNWVIHRFSSLKSLWLLTPLNRLRWFCIRAITHWSFRIFMILIVFAFSYFYRMDPASHLIFLVIFALEMNMKIIAHGFLLHPFTYLRNPWNWIDFILNQIGLTLDFGVHSFHAFHYLRILRLIHFFTHPRLTYSWMFRCLCRMKDPFLYGAFLFCLFTIYAQMFFSGALKNRCTRETWGTTKYNTTELQREVLLILCGNSSGSGTCPESYTCINNINNENPDHGFTSFDNFPLAAVSILRLMARDYMEALYFQIHRTLGPWELPFFLTVMVYGGFYYVNLLMAYIAVGISELLHILEGEKPKQKTKNVKTIRQKLDDTDAFEKEKVNNEVDENKLVQAVESPLVNLGTSNHSAEDEGDAIVQEQVSTVIQINEKQEDNGETCNEYKRRRNPVTLFCMPLVDKFCDWNCCPCWVGFHQKLNVLVSSIYFNVFIVICICVNVLSMALIHHNMTLTVYKVLAWFHVISVMIFVVEAILKILAWSPRHYFKDSANVFDFFIAVLGFLALGLENVGGVSFLRMLRIFQLLRLTRWWPHFSNLMKICQTNIWALCIVAFTFAMMAEGIFQYHYWDGDLLHSRWNFNGGMKSLMTVFRIICGEWIESLWECLPESGAWYCMPFFFSIIIVGNLALFTLFATMLLVAVNSKNLSETEPVSDRTILSVTKNFLSFSWCSTFRRPKRLEEQTAGKSQEELFEMSADEETKTSAGAQLTFGDDVVTLCWCDACYEFLPCCGSPYKGSSTAASATANSTPFWQTWERLRNLSLRIIHNKYFDYGMTAVIMITCTVQSRDLFSPITHHMNLFVIVIYPLELCLQVLGHGCKKFFTNRWHIFDFLVTMLHLIALVIVFWTGAGGGTLALAPIGFRPLKLIPRLKRLRVVIYAILNKLSSFLDVLLACGIFWLFFAILGVGLFGGTFYACIDNEGVILAEVYDKMECLHDTSNNSYISSNSSYLSWANSEYNFDDVGNAFMSLIHVAFMRGWVLVMHSAFDARGVDKQPKLETNMSAGWYFIWFLILGVLGCFTLTLATFLKKSNDQRKQVGGYIEILMTEEQRLEFIQKKGNFFISPVQVSPCPDWWPRRFAYRLVISSQFKLVIILVTSFNAIVLAAITLQTSDLMFNAIFKSDLAFYLVFTLEVLLRIAAFGRNFVKRHWNIYDFVIMVISLIVHSIHPFFPMYVPSPFLFSLLRIVRLVRWLKWVRRIAYRLSLYLPALNNVGFLLLVLIFVYASMALVFYGDVPLTYQSTDLLNFAHFGSALQCVTVMSLGGGWDGVIRSYEGSRWFVLSFLAFLYLILFEAGAVLFLEHYHLLNEKRRLGLTDDALEAFEAAWKILDPDATGYISCDHLSEFLNSMYRPLQICHPNLDEIAALDLPIYKDENVAFNDVLLALLARLDDSGKIGRIGVQSRDDVISSTLKRHREAAAKSAEQELIDS